MQSTVTSYFAEKLQHFRVVNILALLLTSLLVGGCATLDQGECQTANWYDLGQQDGATGKREDTVQAYKQDCAEYGVQVDQAAYQEGWAFGILQFCTREGGFNAGVEGTTYENTCPIEIRDTFFNAYQIGRAIYRARADVEHYRYEVESLGDELAEDNLTSQKRRALRKQRERLQDDLDDAEWALDDALEDARNNGF